MDPNEIVNALTVPIHKVASYADALDAILRSPELRQDYPYCVEDLDELRKLLMETLHRKEATSGC